MAGTPTHLYIMRHAIAVPRETPGFSDDEKRPLTDEGRKQARKVATGLQRLGVEVTTILTSPFVRATQTAEQVAAVYGSSVTVKPFATLKAAAKPQDTSRALAAFAGTASLLLIGHEPHLSAWIGELIGGPGGARCLLKKGGVACIDAEALPPPPGGGALRWLMTPKQLSLVGKA